ncbi:MAG: helix-turn-helix domain-containing protein [Chloroflexia bacterium]|nr:helix-turn-helix domain-containing protein [Chloroflexia bacterium]
MEIDIAACDHAFTTHDARFDGRVFAAVQTTGIYCRPICSARPNRENVSYYLSAAAAQAAGFRPCLRCRPELSPNIAVWHGSSATVTRALALIEAGALDDGDVEVLAQTLGLSGRQLRRLFKQHLGATPIAVAQTRRVLLAKQLIYETDLTMTDVALAAGFGSVRRFNETFQRLFQRPPGALRRSKGTERSDAAVAIQLAYRPPYDWDAILAFLATRAIPGVEVVADNHYARTIAIGELAGTLVVAPGAGSTLQVTVRFPRLDALPRIIARTRAIFDLAANPTLIAEQLSTDPRLAPLVAARPGLRVPGGWDGFELAVRAILGQQITVAGARRLAGHLVATYGEPFDDAAAQAIGLSHLFPAPSRLAGADIAALGLMPRARAAALSSLAGAVATDSALLGPYRDLDSAVATLRSLPGIGEWTAHYVAMRALRETDAFPAADVGLQRAMSDEMGRRPTAAELLTWADAWRPWRAYAAIHLWASLTPTASRARTTDREQDAA